MVVVLACCFAGLVALLAGPRLGRWLFAVVALPLAAGAVWLLSLTGDALDGDPVTGRLTWVGGLGLNLNTRVDGFAWMMGLVVTVVGVAVAWYSAHYFSPSDHLHRFAAAFVAFAGAMFGLVLADDVFTLFVFWEATSVTSFLLIGYNDRSADSRRAALRALLVTGTGGVFLLGGLAMLAREAGTTSLTALLADPPSGRLVDAALVFVLVGAFTKSAQFPFHFWLPGAMAAPTPVSAYLHSATMVKAGVVLVARFAPAFADAPPWRPMIAVAGAASLLLGGFQALRQHDGKLLLAHGTVSQLGLLMLLAGMGEPALTYAAVAMLLAHALFKAALFLVVGVVDHSTHTRDIRRLDGLGRQAPLLATVAGLAALSMAAVPPLFGFATKEKALDSLLHADLGATGALVTVAFVAGAVLTVAYTARFWWGTFGSTPSVRRPAAGDPAHHGPARLEHPPGAALLASPLVFAVASLVAGIVASKVGGTLADVAVALDTKAAKKLVLWPGVNTALLLSAAAIAVGVALAAVTRPGGRRALTDPRPVAPAVRVYDTVYDGLLRESKRATGLVQNGSLPAYVSVVFVTLVGLVVSALALGVDIDTDLLVGADSAAQVALAALVVATAVAVVLAKHRFVSVLLLGGVGYGLALLYLLHGAPDLAITQLLVETLTIVVFLLTLRQLPPRFMPSPRWAPLGVRVGIAVVVGACFSVLALVAGTAGPDRTASAEAFARSVDDAGGHNVVNVILVDFRAMDTMGEITVLALAAAGVANLVRAARRAARRHEAAASSSPAPDVNGTEVTS
jgi:multicomponent Na+:H+ antiporter subunit A